MGWLKGKRTVLVQAAAILTALGAYAGGELSLEKFLVAVYTALTITYGALKANGIKEAIKNGK